MWALKTISEVASELADRCREVRLSQNMTQQEVAARAGISLRTYRRFEQEKQISLERFVAVVHALNRMGDLESLLQPPPVRDLKELDSAVPKRKRARNR
ncbi:MAG: helix-turn-helix domain-containing protein [Kiritimatiellales bacterium]|nr:helix-turn-helix domain-containing protein [Kiritimatiellales bacterium]